MKSQHRIRLFLPLLAILIAGLGELAGQTESSTAALPQAVSPAQHLFAQWQYRGSDERSETEQWPPESERRSAEQRRVDRLNMIKMWVLDEYLELSREQQNAFFPRATEHEQQINANMLEQRQLYEAFQQKIRDGEVNAEDVEQYISEKTILEKSQIDMHNDYLQSMKDLLSDEQLAKLAVFDEYFINRIGEDFRRDQP